MTIERRVPKIIPKRLPEIIVDKHEKIGKNLGLQEVPVHTLAWKEMRLDLNSGDCYPLVDVLEAMAAQIAELKKDLAGTGQKPAPKKRTTRKKSGEDKVD